MNLIENIIYRYDFLYKHGLTPWNYDKISPQFKMIAKQMRKKIREGKLLDIGCGEGWLSIYFAKRGFLSYGIDSAALALKAAKNAAKNAGVKLSFKKGNALDFPYLDCFFDIVVDRGFFHHLPEKWWPVYMKGLQRVLKPGGLYYLATFSTKTTRMQSKTLRDGVLWKKFKDESGYFTYDHFFTKELILKLFHKNFDLVCFTEDEEIKAHGTHLIHFLFMKR